MLKIYNELSNSEYKYSCLKTEFQNNFFCVFSDVKKEINYPFVYDK